MLEKFEKAVEEFGTVDKKAVLEGRQLTMFIAPLKNAAKINEIGEELEAVYGVRHLPSDFKKRGGYQRSIELSKEYGLYRQDYCGCVFSKQEREQQKERFQMTDPEPAAQEG